MTSSGLDHAHFCRHHQFIGVWGLCVELLLLVSDAIMTSASRMTKQSKISQYYRCGNVALMKLSIVMTCCYGKLVNYGVVTVTHVGTHHTTPC